MSGEKRNLLNSTQILTVPSAVPLQGALGLRLMFSKKKDFLNLTQILTVCGVPSAFPLGGASGSSNFYHSHNLPSAT